MAIDGILYDGLSAHRQKVKLEPLRDCVEIAYGDGYSEEVDAKLLTRLQRDPQSLRLGRTDVTGWRLILPSVAEPEVAHLLATEERYGRWIDRIGFIPALAVFGAMTVAIISIGYAAPQWLAPHVPYSWERNLGTAIVGDFGDYRCRNSEGQRALEALTERLEPGATRGDRPIRVAALDVPIFNAAALPGGHIVLFKPAITETESVEELAGMLAHEIAHVRRRHVTEALIRELGIGALIRLFAGDIGANAEQLVALSYTREHEAEADADAIAMLKRARIDPRPTARLFERLAEGEGGGPGFDAEFLNSHPVSSGRAKRFASAFDPNAAYRPALNRDQADALFNICRSPPQQQRER